MNYKVVCFGEVLWDVLPEGKKLGGAPLNVAYHLNQLGVPAVMVSRIGNDELGTEILDEMNKRNLSKEFIQIDHERRTSIVNAIPGPNNEMKYEFTPNIAWDAIEWQPALEELVKGSDYFVFGSLAAREQTTTNTLYRLLDVANKTIYDVNLRAPHFSQQVVEGLMHKADWVKMNDNELNIMAEWVGLEGSEEDKVYALHLRFDLDWIIVTKGEHGAFINVDGKFYRHNGYKVNVADTVGSGDSFLAAIIAKTIEGKSPEDALDFACKTGAFIASKTGGTPIYDMTEIDNIR